MRLERKQAFVLALSIAVLVASALILKELVSEQNAESDEYKLRVEMLLRDALRAVEEIRGLSPLEHVEIEVVTISWARENWGRSYAEACRENILREERIYKALFMIPENVSLYEAKVEWAGVIVSAVWQDKIYVVREYFNPWGPNSMETLVHELTHILQGKYFQIPDRPTHDGRKAKDALIEGDACLMGEAYVNKTKEHGLVEVINEQPLTERGEKPQFSEYAAKLPDSISRLNYFPYEYGLKFVRTLHARGGWEAVNQAYENPPTTTEQIMHPSKYFAGEDALEVEELAVTEGGWQKIKSDRFGEHFILVMLGGWIPWDEAEKAAEGWGGDNFAYYERGDDYLFTWNITWDSTEEASEFYASFREMMNKTGAEEEAQNLWRAHGRYLSMRWEGASTLIVSSTSEDAVEKIVEGACSSGDSSCEYGRVTYDGFAFSSKSLFTFRRELQLVVAAGLGNRGSSREERSQTRGRTAPLFISHKDSSLPSSGL